MGDDDDSKKGQKPKRKYLKSEFSDLADIAVSISKLLMDTINLIGDNNLREVARELHLTETKGDEIRDRVIKSFSLDKHPPSLQLDRMDLLKKIDTMINKCEYACSQIELAGKYYPSSLLPDLKEIMENVLTTVSATSEGVKLLFDSFEDAVDVIKNVEDTRNKTRDLAYQLQFKALDDISISHQSLFAVDKISTQVSSVAEKAKEIADVLDRMKLKYL